MQAYSAPDYSALLRNIGKLPPEEGLVTPRSEKEGMCAGIYAQFMGQEAIPSSAYDLPLHIASSPAASHALTRITDLLVAFNESNRTFVLVRANLKNDTRSYDMDHNLRSHFVLLLPPL